jgi:hypothetical protein
MKISAALTSINTNLLLNGNLNGISPTIIGYLSGLSSNAQSQLTALQTKTTNISYGSNTTTFNGSLAFSSTVGQKLILYPSSVSSFNNFMLGIEGGTIRYNTDFGCTHLFSSSNASTATSYLDLLRITPSLTTVSTNLTVTGNINGVTPTIMSYLDASSSIQTQLTTLQNKTTDLTK